MAPRKKTPQKTPDPTLEDLQEWEDILNARGKYAKHSAYPKTHPERHKYEALIRDLRAQLATPCKQP